MSYKQGGDEAWNTLPSTQVHVRMRCVRCGYLSPRKCVAVVPSAFGAANKRLPMPPRRCKGCHIRCPAVDYVT